MRSHRQPLTRSCLASQISRSGYGEVSAHSPRAAGIGESALSATHDSQLTEVKLALPKGSPGFRAFAPVLNEGWPPQSNQHVHGNHGSQRRGRRAAGVVGHEVVSSREEGTMASSSMTLLSLVPPDPLLVEESVGPSFRGPSPSAITKVPRQRRRRSCRHPSPPEGSSCYQAYATFTDSLSFYLSYESASGRPGRPLSHQQTPPLQLKFICRSSL